MWVILHKYTKKDKDMKNDKLIEAYKKVIDESFTPTQPAKLVAVLYEAEEGADWTETDSREFTSDRKARELGGKAEAN